MRTSVRSVAAAPSFGSRWVKSVTGMAADQLASLRTPSIVMACPCSLEACTAATAADVCFRVSLWPVRSRPAMARDMAMMVNGSPTREPPPADRMGVCGGRLLNRAPRRSNARLRRREWRKGCLLQNFLEEGHGAGVLALSQPEECGSPELRIVVGPRNSYQGRHRFICRSLRQREDCMLPNLPVSMVIPGDGVQGQPRCFARGLPQPEDGPAPQLLRQSRAPCDLHQ